MEGKTLKEKVSTRVLPVSGAKGMLTFWLTKVLNDNVAAVSSKKQHYHQFKNQEITEVLMKIKTCLLSCFVCVL